MWEVKHASKRCFEPSPRMSLRENGGFLLTVNDESTEAMLHAPCDTSPFITAANPDFVP
jgi:hypothetical protein